MSTPDLSGSDAPIPVISRDIVRPSPASPGHHPAGGDSHAAYMKAGAWPERALPPTYETASGAEVPWLTAHVCIALPCVIVVQNLPEAELRDQINSKLGLDHDDRGDAVFKVAQPLDGGAPWSAAEIVLRMRNRPDSELSGEIATLQTVIAGFPEAEGGAAAVPPSVKELIVWRDRLIEIQRGNQHLEGEGTVQNPFRVREGSLYITAPQRLVFCGCKDIEVKCTGAQTFSVEPARG